jgi:hypothetical protein
MQNQPHAETENISSSLPIDGLIASNPPWPVHPKSGDFHWTGSILLNTSA